MAKQTIAFTNFTAGELSPRLDGRTDLGKYFNGSKTLENMVVHPHGAASRRPGTKFVHEVKSSAAVTRLIPFEFSTTQTYILELGNLYIRFFKDKGIITEADKTITGVTQANPAVVTISSHGYSNDDHVIITGVVGMTQLNGKTFKVAGVSTNTFQLQTVDGVAINSTGYTAYSSAGTSNKIYQITSPFTTSQIPTVKFAQSADIMYMVHPSHPIQKLSRTGHTAWTITTPTLTTSDDVTVSAVTQANPGVVTTAKSHKYVKGDLITFTGVGGMTQLNGNTYTVGTILNEFSMSAVTQANPGVVTTTAAHNLAVGDDISIKDVKGMTQLNDNYYTVKTVPSSTTFSLADSVGTNLNTSGYTAYSSAGTVTTPDTRFELQDSAGVNLNTSGYGSFSASGNDIINKLTDPLLNRGADTYPSCVSFFEQRLVFAGSNNDPQSIWYSKSGSYENFTTGVNASDAMVYTIASNKVNAIRYMSAQRSLIVGTVGGEFVVSASGTTSPITPTNIQIQKQSSYGAANIDAVQIENVTMFLQRAKRKVRELTYNINIDQYQAADMTLLAEHISEGGITEMAYQQEPDSVLWCVRSDGTLLGFTYARAEEVVGWHRHILGGAFGSGQAVIESVASIPTDSNEDELYMIVKRTVNSVTRRYVEYLNLFDYGTDQKDAFFVDSGLTYSGSATTSISGLDHLEGQVVTILADGATHPDKTVSSGAVTLDRSSSKVHIGLPYTSLLQTMRIESQGNEATSQSKTKRINEVTLRLHETVGVEVGASLTDMERIPFRSSAAAMNTAVPLFTGDKQVEFRDDFNTDGHVYVRQTQPLPLTLISLYPMITINDG
tara:strand:- start:5290 stop:7797 length:2508 start_codon:yes stop_codon:yes gene_type:complete